MKRTFFLLEILVAMAIFSLAILPLLTMEWGIFISEKEDKKRFNFERLIKQSAVKEIENLYFGTKHLKDLAEPLPIEGGALPGYLLFDGEKQGGTLILRFVLPNGEERDFSLPIKTAK